MEYLYDGGGSSDYDGSLTDPEEADRLLRNIGQLLKHRGKNEAVAYITSIPFRLLDSMNHFCDEFSVLEAAVPLEQYDMLRSLSREERRAFRHIAEAAREIGTYVRFITVKPSFDQPIMVKAPRLTFTSDVVEHALADAERLLSTRSATSGVDRVHTALHGHVRLLCHEAGLTVESDASLPALFKTLRDRHPTYNAGGPRSEDVTKVLRSLGAILDALGTLRNNATVAHPNDALLSEPEARLAVNCARTILRYLDDKTPSQSRGATREA